MHRFKNPCLFNETKYFLQYDHVSSLLTDGNTTYFLAPKDETQRR